MKGIHIGKTDRVEITQQKGGGVIYTNLIPKKVVPAPVAEPALALNDDPTLVVAPVDPNEVHKKVMNMSRRDLALELSRAYEENPSEVNYQALIDFKRSCKVSWEKLGITEPMDPTDQAFVKKVPAAVEPEPLQEAEPLTNREKIQAMLPATTKEQAEAILTIKRQCKKSWDHLGVSPSELANIYNLIG
jgi:hypothetical protein